MFFCSARDLNCISLVRLVNEIIRNDCRVKGYHVKAIACTKLVNNTQKDSKRPVKQQIF